MVHLSIKNEDLEYHKFAVSIRKYTYMGLFDICKFAWFARETILEGNVARIDTKLRFYEGNGGILEWLRGEGRRLFKSSAECLVNPIYYCTVYRAWNLNSTYLEVGLWVKAFEFQSTADISWTMSGIAWRACSCCRCIDDRKKDRRKELVERYHFR